MATVKKDGTVEVDLLALGEKLLQKGRKSLKSLNFIKGDNRYKKGVEYLEKAGLQFRLAESWEKAGLAFEEAAMSYLVYIMKKTGNSMEYAKLLEKGAECFMVYNYGKGLELYLQAAQVKKEANNFSGAAQIYRTLAEIEQNRLNVRGAMDFYDQAYDAFTASDSTATAGQCAVAKADFATQIGDYNDASELYLKVITSNCLPFENVKLGCKAILSKFVYFALQNDVPALHKFIDEVQSKTPRWSDSYEATIVRKLVTAYLDGPVAVKTFSKTCHDFDKSIGLTAWSTELLLKIKQILIGEYKDDDEAQNGKDKPTQAELVAKLIV